MNTTKRKLRVPIEKVTFRASKIGLLAGGLIRHGLTSNQHAEMEKLETQLKTPVGLSDKQQKDFDSWDLKIKEGGNLTTSQMEKRDDYKLRLKTPKPLTVNQSERLQELKEKNAKQPELSDGAKTYIKSVWLQNEKNFIEDINSKYLKKGIQAEEDAIFLVSMLDKLMYMKNEKRITKGHLTGECDIKQRFKDADLLVVDDTKCSWNPRTFMNAELTTLYEWQGRAYLYLYDADIFRLRYVLTDCPPDVYAEEYRKFCFQNGIIDDTLPEYQDAISQFKANHIYSDSELYTQDERVKTYNIVRDFELEKIMLDSIKLAIEYYQTITLNMIENAA